MVVPDFARVLQGHDLAPLTRGRVTTLQVNVGKRCNQACHHCHVDAGPKRTEMMGRPVAEQIVALLAQNPEVEGLDVTGGAPELNEHFRYLVAEARRLGRRVIDRCNLTVLLEPEMDDLAEFLAQHAVEIVASLPCYREGNVDEQRGVGVFAKSIAALQRLNALGYGHSDSGLALDLVYNPVGAFLPPSQVELEGQYRDELRERFGIEFRKLLTITNMPIKRFAAWLAREGQVDAYLGLLVNHFNAATVRDLMCRSLLSVGWDGRLYDCDFNQMLDLLLPAGAGHHARTIWELDALEVCNGQRIATGSHCFGCTAGAGSSCGGALQ